MCLSSTSYSEGEYAQRLQHFAADVPKITYVTFEPLFYTTKEFYDWWTVHFVQSNGTLKSFKARLNHAFEVMQQNFRKGMAYYCNR